MEPVQPQPRRVRARVWINQVNRRPQRITRPIYPLQPATNGLPKLNEQMCQRLGRMSVTLQNRLNIKSQLLAGEEQIFIFG